MTQKLRRCRLAKVSDLIPPDGHCLDVKVVDEIAASIPDCGIRQPIVVVGRHILHGVHRWAAAKLAGLETIEVIDDEKADSAERNEVRVIVENLERRHLPQAEIDRLRKRLVDLKVPQIAQEMHSAPKAKPLRDRQTEAAPTPPRKHTTAHGEAVRQVARATGVTPRAVECSIARASAASERLESAMADGDLDNLDEYQNPIRKEKRKTWDVLREKHQALGELLRRAQATCTDIIALGGEPMSYGQRWREALHTVAHETRSLMPYAVCPKCGGDKRDKPCDLCRGTGFVFEAGLAKAKYEKLTGMEQ